MANYMNPYDFIQPLMGSPVPNINSGITAGMNLSKLGPEIANTQALTDYRRAETEKMRRANQALNDLIGSGVATEGPLTVDKALKMRLAGIDPTPLLAIQKDARTQAGAQQFTDWFKTRTAPVTETVPVYQSDDTMGVDVKVGEKQETRQALPVSVEEIIKQRMKIPELQQEAVKDLTTLAGLEKAALTAQTKQERDFYLNAYRNSLLIIKQQHEDISAARIAALAAGGNRPEKDWASSGQVDEATGQLILFNKSTGETKLGGVKVGAKPKTGAKKDEPGAAVKEKNWFTDFFRPPDEENVPVVGRPAGMPPDAKPASDGKWYRPDPNRPGKYLLILQD